MANNLLKCRILTGDKIGEIAFIHRITLFSDERNYLFTFKRRQFPVKSVFAMTINKFQGQTFWNIGIDLTKNVFNHGQLYVAMSRVRSWQALAIFTNIHQKNRKIGNIFFKYCIKYQEY